MSAYSQAVAAIRAARAARDAARDELYALELRGLALERAARRGARGEGALDPGAAGAVRALEDERVRAAVRRAAVDERIAALRGLPATLAKLEARAAALRARSAALADEASALGAALEQARGPAREAAMERLRAVQASRAETEHQAKPLRDRADALRAQVDKAGAELQALGAEADQLEARLAEIDRETERVAAASGEIDLQREGARHTERVGGARASAAALEDGVRAAIAGLWGQRTPEELTAAWDDGLPVLLLPLRVETRWKTDQPVPELWVRVYPDDVAVNTHEKVLTDAELRHGRAYWTARSEAATDEARDQAWRGLAERFGANRAAWVAPETRPLNWDEAVADPARPLHFPDPPLTKPDAWTVAPHTRVLPDRFVLMAWRGDDLRLNVKGALIDDVVVLGPSPLEDGEGGASLEREADGTLRMGPSFDWVRDFGRAVVQGMAFRVRLDDPDDARLGFDRLLVLGLKHSADETDAQALVEDLLHNHRYSRDGFSLVAQGTPTNNTGGADAGWTRDGSGAEESTPDGGPDLFSPAADRNVAADGQRLADFLGIGYGPLLRAPGAGLSDHADAVAMNRALYAGTLGYYLDHALNEVVDEDVLPPLRRHFTTQVTGRGPVAAIRVGSQPYGILPTSAFSRWSPTPVRRDPVTGVAAGISAAAAAVPDPMEAGLYRVLARLDEAWSAVTPGPAQVGAPGAGAARLLDVLGLHPTSAEFYQRVGYSWDYLQNLESFAWAGSDFDEVWRMAVEGMLARSVLKGLGARELREDGTRKPIPLLLQLIWRSYHTELDPGQLIDGRPLSESDGIRPYDEGSGRTYLDWLMDHAADAEALEAQSFGAAGRPGYLLYMLLHFSLVMEAGRGIHGWLGDRGIRADELVRSRKFLNIGSQPTPSAWEVFRAPANQVVRNEASSLPLLSLLHTPQLAAGAGEGVREQRAGLDALRGMSTARLERALVEHVDTLGYRLDAWQTSLFSRRLHRQRRMDAPVAQRRTGVYLGAYGYLEELRPTPGRRTRVAESTLPPELRQGAETLFHESGNGGYVHAPSMNHATAAALLRNGYLTHATPDRPDALAVNLSSERVSRARYLLEGLRNGQSLEVLLGAQFERGLHDWTTRPGSPVVLDHLKPAFRAAFPIRRTRVPQAADAAAGAAEVAEDHTVVNGLDLARTTEAYPYGIADLQGLSGEQRDAILAEKAAIENTLDALRDVLTAEAAYQLALGNFDRAAAVVQSTGSATAPPDVEVLRTPRGTGISFTNRLAVQLSAGMEDNPWPAIPLTERARMEPALNHWLGMLLGDPATIVCRVRAEEPPPPPPSPAPDPPVPPAVPVVLAEGAVSLAELRVQPIDFVYMARAQSEETGAAELEARIRHGFCRSHGVTDDAVVRIAFADAGGAAGARPFAEVLPLAERLRRLLGLARPLNARHFQSASKDAPAPAGNPGLLRVDELHTRVSARLAAVRGLFAPLQAAADAARGASPPGPAVEGLRTALEDVAGAGFGYAVPVSATGTAPAQVEALVAQADSLLERAAALGPATDDQLARAAPAAAGTAEQKAALLGEAARAWLGGDFVLLPRFTFIDAAAVDQAHADRAALLAFARGPGGSPLPVEEWLHGAACVRPQVHAFEMVRAMADAALADPLELSPIQLPFRAGDSWLGVRYPTAMEVVHDTVSVVRHLPQGFAAAGDQCGLLVDEWGESIPTREEVTGITFNYNAPDSAPPQALLLAVTPRETGSWQWQDLVETVLDTFRRARLRAVEPEAVEEMGGIGVLLPAVLAEFSTSRGSVSLDYSFLEDAIRIPALAMMTRTAAPGAGEG